MLWHLQGLRNLSKEGFYNGKGDDDDDD